MQSTELASLEEEKDGRSPSESMLYEPFALQQNNTVSLCMQKSGDTSHVKKAHVRNATNIPLHTSCFDGCLGNAYRGGAFFLYVPSF